MNSNHKLKLINYIFVSHLILSNYSMKLSSLMRDLSLDIKMTRTHAIKIGCSVVGGKAANSDYDAFSVTEINASLTCPLTFASIGDRKRKRY